MNSHEWKPRAVSVNGSGKLLLPSWVEFIFPAFFYDRATIKSNGKYGFLNRKMEIIIPCRYEGAYIFKEGMAQVRSNNLSGYINTLGKEIIPCKYETTFQFSEGLAAVKEKGKWGFIDKQGKIIIDFKYDNACDFSEDIACVNLNGRNGYINKKENFSLIDSEFSWIEGFDNGMAEIVKKGKHYFINKRGTILCTADWAYGLS